MNKLTRFIFNFASLALLTRGSVACAQSGYAYFPADAAITSTVTASYAVVGYADYNDLSSRANGSSPTIYLPGSGYVSGDLDAYNSSAIHVVGGGASEVDAYDSSTVDMSSGRIQYNLYAHNNSVVTVRGGSIGYYLEAYDNSVVNFSRGLVSSYMTADSNSTVNFSGGTVNGFLQGVGSSILNVSGGDFGSLQVAGNAVLNITGGASGGLRCDGDSVVNVRGGSLSYTYYVGSRSVMNLYGLGLSDTLVSPGVGGFSYSKYRLSGKLLDGKDVTGVTVYVEEGVGAKLTITSVPEPGLNALFVGLAGGASLLFFRCRKARRRADSNASTLPAAGFADGTVPTRRGRKLKCSCP